MLNQNIIWRIDDRLIHGQVIIGWCSQLPIQELAVCDDEIAAASWEKDLLIMAAPKEIPTQVLSTEEIIKQIETWLELDKIVLVLIKSPSVILKLINSGVKIENVNVGGIHFVEGRKEYLSYVYLSDDDVQIFKNLFKKGIKFECQDLPNSPVYNLKKVIEKKQ